MRFDFRFPIDWIDGSQVVNILLGTSMATILLPKYYPLIGTSRIKLLSFKGRVDSAVKKFKVCHLNALFLVK